MIANTPILIKNLELNVVRHTHYSTAVSIIYNKNAKLFFLKKTTRRFLLYKRIFWH